MVKVLDVVNVGLNLGLDLDSAYFEVMSHYDLFFNIETFREDHIILVKELKALGLIGEDKLLIDVDLDELKVRLTSG